MNNQAKFAKQRTLPDMFNVESIVRKLYISKKKTNLFFVKCYKIAYIYFLISNIKVYYYFVRSLELKTNIRTFNLDTI